MSLERRKPLRAQPRSKGNRAEREIIDMCHRYGWTGAYRNFQSGTTNYHDRYLRRQKRNPIFAFHYWRARRQLRKGAD